MILGFTGTRLGMTPEQRSVVHSLVLQWWPSELVHGDAIGADAQFDGIGEVFKIERGIYPSDIPIMRAFCDRKPVPAKMLGSPARPLLRNKWIVHRADGMIATPKLEHREEQRSGTWACIRFARSTGKKVVIVWPSGDVTR